MPYSVAELLSALATGSAGRVATSPCIAGHAVQITAAIRELHWPEIRPDNWRPPDLAEWRVVGEYIATRWTGGIDIGPAWAATAGKLADALAKARRWVAAGKPSNGKAGMAVSPCSSDPSAPGTPEEDYERRKAGMTWQEYRDAKSALTGRASA